jgi:hypothetical protein
MYFLIRRVFGIGVFLLLATNICRHEFIPQNTDMCIKVWVGLTSSNCISNYAH